MKQSRMSNEYNHEVVFVIKQKNMEELTRFLHDVSDPLSDNYGQHMTRTGVTELTSNPEGRNSVLEYLHATGATVVSETLGGEYITAAAPIGVWEEMFDCEFHVFHQTREDMSIEEFVRTEFYSLPAILDNHVESVFNTVDMSHNDVIESRLWPGVGIAGDGKFDLEETPFITPAKLRAAYNMGTSRGTAFSTQGVYDSAGQYYSPADLSQFQTYFNLDQQPISNVIGGHQSDSACSVPSVCNGGNVRTQYMMAASPVSPTTYWYTELSIFDWLLLVANTPQPSLVYNIAFYVLESSLTTSLYDSFNTQAIKLGAMGVTIVVPSGDNGASSLGVCLYLPTFPASSPYVTVVGATMVSFHHSFQL
jgi:tripeptidyl-peptidase I